MKASEPKPDAVFWKLALELYAQDLGVRESTIMNGRCLRVGDEFLALVDFKGSGLVVKLPKARVAALVNSGVGRPFAPAGRVFAEWVSVPDVNARVWRALLAEGVAFARKAKKSGRRKP